MVARMHVTVTEKGGPSREEVFDQNELTFGRVQGNDVVLPKGNISKRHARVVWRDRKLIVVDLKTTNGTFVNGKRIQSPQVLKEGDKIYVGDFTLVVRATDGGRPTADPPTPPSPPPRPDAPPRPLRQHGTAHETAAFAKATVWALRDERIRQVELVEGQPLRLTPSDLIEAPGPPASSAVIVALLRSLGIELTDQRPVYDGPLSVPPGWRVTAQALDGAPVRARFQRGTRISLDDDIDPVPPG